ncbi:4-(cytidine 5'-diphospho)-2-C-methyl-D-erythritol kinase [Rhodospirillales bacterium 47_12_T64]|nr:4-(cytidine 5'-diphospho)-2-C-methyl-D-erythritol kinase [Rhodospirillales bacterium 47_12_T64]
MNRITEYAPAKVNLTLQVVGRRDDGYHLLHSLVGFSGVGDVLHFTPSSELSLKVSGPFARGLKDSAPENNLVIRAVQALSIYCEVKQGVEIHLIKNLPVASGIGGGSADAAATLRGLARLWEIEGLAQEQTRQLALSLGADVPVCLEDRCRWMEGIGEKLSIGPELPGLFTVLLNPGVAVSTPEIFKNLNGQFSTRKPKPVSFSSVDDLSRYLIEAGNDLQRPACEQQPIINEALSKLKQQQGCRFSGMSGSGATCFGLYSSFENAEKAASAISKERPGWWSVSTNVI